MRLDADAEPPVILNSPELVSRAVSNVIDNARTWSAEDGTVEVSLRDGVLTVRDHGPGFALDDLERVFDRFYRSDDARRLPGSGLGLAIVKQAAEAQGAPSRPATRRGVARSFGSPSDPPTPATSPPPTDASRLCRTG